MKIIRFIFVNSWKAYVSLLDLHSHVAKTDVLDIAAGSGKSVLSCVNLYIFPFTSRRTYISDKFHDHSGCRKIGETELVSMGVFYCDFRDDEKRNRRGLLASLLLQLFEQSDTTTMSRRDT